MISAEAPVFFSSLEEAKHINHLANRSISIAYALELEVPNRHRELCWLQSSACQYYQYLFIWASLGKQFHNRFCTFCCAVNGLID